MFRTFATQLESGLKDSNSGRDSSRIFDGAGKKMKKKGENDGARSLPEIKGS